MANQNVQNVRFLRNGTLFESREAARTALNGQTLTTEKDGSAILARYGSGNAVKTLVGWVFYAANDSKSITIFDIDDIGTDVQQAIDEINSKIGTGITTANTATAQLAALSGSSSDTSATTSVAGAKKYADQKISDAVSALDYSDTAVAGSYVSQVTEADGVIAVERVALPDASTVSGDSKVVIDVTQDKGAITATASNITGVKLAGYSEGTDADIASTDTLGEALGKLQAQINAMDLTVISGNGEVITSISEADGKVSASKTAIKDVKLTGYVKDSSVIGSIEATDDIEDALSKLENKAAAITIANADGSINVTTGVSGTDINVNIKSSEKVLAKDGNNGIYTDIKLSGITPSSTTVKEEYALIATDGSQLGTSIKVYKDSSVVNITYQSDPEEAHYQNLIYTYVDISGNTQTEYVDISALVLEAEFASGITVTDHVAHGVVDPTSENFLTVGANGFKLSGVQDAIGTAISGLDVSDSAVAGKYVSQVSETDGKISVSRANVSEAILNNYSKGSTSGAVTSTDTVNEAISKLEVRIDGEIAALDATVSGETTDGKVNVKVTETDGKITAVDVVGTDIASSSALTAEITARKAVDGQNGQIYVANANKTYITGATSLNDADIKLNDALKSLSDETVNQVKVNNIALAETSNAVNIQISAVNGTGASATPIVINTDSNTGAVTIQLEGIDCGTY